MSSDTMFPDSVFTLWRFTLVLVLVVFVPLSVYLLHSTWRATRSIRNYSRDILTAARGIETSTAAIPATNDTVSVGTDILAASEAVAHKLAGMASALEARSRRA